MTRSMDQSGGRDYVPKSQRLKGAGGETTAPTNQNNGKSRLVRYSELIKRHGEDFGHHYVTLFEFLALVALCLVTFAMLKQPIFFWFRNEGWPIVATLLIAVIVTAAPKDKKGIARFVMFVQVLLFGVALVQMHGGWGACAVNPKTGLSPCAFADDGTLHYGDWEGCDDGHCVVGGTGSKTATKILKPQANAPDASVAAQIAGAYKANPCLAEPGGCKGKVKAPSFGPVPDTQLTYQGASAYVRGENGTPSESRICIEGGGSLSYDFVDATPGSEWDVVVHYRNDPTHPVSHLWTEGHPWQLGPKGPGWGAHCFTFTLIGDAKKYPSAGLTVKITGG